MAGNQQLDDLNPEQLLEFARDRRYQKKFQTALDAFDNLLRNDTVPWTDTNKQDALIDMDSLNYHNSKARAKVYKNNGAAWSQAALQFVQSVQGLETAINNNHPSMRRWLNRRMSGLLDELRDEVESVATALQKIP